MLVAAVQLRHGLMPMHVTAKAILKAACVQGIQDAFVTVSLVDGKGNVMGRQQDTPTTNNLAGNYVLFNCEVCWH